MAMTDLDVKISARRGFVVTAIALATLSVVALVPVLGNDFVNWDDLGNFLENQHFRGIGRSQIAWAWSTFWLGVYQPLAWMLFELEYIIFGLQPWGYHLTSVMMHALVSVAVYALAYRVLFLALDGSSVGLGPRKLASALAAALFAVHPLRVEAVAWASCQPYLPCALFAILSAIAYLRANEGGQGSERFWIVVAILAFLSSLLSHATAVGLPLILLALDIYPLRRIDLHSISSTRRAIFGKWPFLLASFIFSAIGYLAKKHTGATEGDMPELSDKLAKAGHALWVYPWKTLVPLGLQVHYPTPVHSLMTDPTYFLPTLGAVGVTAVAIVLRRRWPGLLSAWTCYVAVLLPNLGLISLGTQVVADRYAYLSSVVLAVSVAYAFALVARARPHVLSAAAAGIVLALTALTWLQCLTWKDSETLWSRSLRIGGMSDSIAETNLGQALYRAGKHGEALAHIVRAARLRPRDVKSQLNLAAALLRMEWVDEAVLQYKAAVALDPKYADGHVRFARALSRQGRSREAADQLTIAVGLRPDLTEPRRRLAFTLAELGRFAEARLQYDAVLRREPDDAATQLALGRVLAELGQLRDAADRLRQAVRLSPDSADHHFALGLVLADLGSNREAVDEFREVLRLRPGDDQARRELDRVLR